MIKQEIIEQLKSDEGFTATSFWDYKQWTWGYGTKAPGPQATISREDAEVELAKAVDVAIDAYHRIFSETTVEINEVRQQALVNMIYNMGAPTFSKFRNTLKAINAGNWGLAAEHARDSLWFKQVTRRARRICNELQKGVKASGIKQK